MKETNQITFEPSEIPSDPKNFQLSSKKYQKIKNEIDLQNFEVAKLTRELKMRTEHCFSADCLQQTKTELNNARKKLNLMIKCAMNEQKKSGENWGPIPLAFDRSSSSSLFCLEPNTPSNISEISGLNNHKLELDDFETLEEDRFSLQREILFKDKMLQELEQNLEATQCQILRISQENKAMTRRLNETQTETCRKHLNTKLNMQVEKATKLSYTIEKLSTNLKNLRCELDKLKEEKKISVNIQNCKNSSPCKCPGLSEDARKLKIFESKYSNLQNEFCQREKQHKEMTERMKIFLNNCNDDKEQAVNEALKKRARELDDEISENKIFIEELQEQVAIYRDKFMKC